MTQSLLTLNSCLAQHLLPLIKQNRYCTHIHTCTGNLVVCMDYEDDGFVYIVTGDGLSPYLAAHTLAVFAFVFLH